MPQAKPNILFILADDMGYGDFSAFNAGLSRTPTLDALIEEGVCLTQHYSASCVCSPARAALLTGRVPHRTGAIEMRERRGLCNLAARETTVAAALRPAGYATGLVGKWHNGSLGRAFSPNGHGFDEFAGFRGGGMDYWDWAIQHNERHQEADGRYLTDVFTEEAVGFIERHAAEPFFLHVCYNAPHSPLQAPEDEVRPFLRDDLPEQVSTLYGMVHRMDSGIARILDTLDRHGLRDNTLVLFTSDNGPAGRRFNCNFNGGKGNVYEGGIRLPMVVRWPAGLDGGRQLDGMTHLCDWMPTLMAAAGAEPPLDRKLDGVNLLPLLQGRRQELPTQRFWQWNRYQPMATTNAAMRDGDWKLLRPVVAGSTWTAREEMESDAHMRRHLWEHYEPDISPFPPRELGEVPPAELYNIAKDPGEQNNLADRHPDRVHRMLSELETWFEDVEADRASIGGPWVGYEPDLRP